MSQAQLPDRRLAKAFNFTAEDLQANRNGYLTWRQRNRSEDWLVLIGQMLTQRVGGETLRDIEQREGRVESMCGRIIVDYKQTQIQSFFHADFTETYSLKLENSDDGFYINREQFLYLVNYQQIPHRIYFLADTGIVLSIERIQCPDEE